MGTRSVTKIYDQFNGDIICSMYCQFDGYPSGVGADIKSCIKGINIVNGYNDSTPRPFVNRMGKLATYLAKNSGIDYEFQSVESESDWIDYTYNLRFKDGRVWLDLESYGGVIYSGFVDDFDPEMEECEE